MSSIKDIVEALLFASGIPVAKKDLVDKVDGLTASALNSAVKELQKKYSGDSGVVLIEFNGKLQLSTNPTYGDAVAEVLTPLKEKELTKTLLEVLATIAYKQPITRLELDDMRGVSSEYALAALLKAHLIEVVGRKDTVGRPQLYGTTDDFLKKFELNTLEDLPDLVEVMEKIQLIYTPPEETLFHNRSIFDSEEESNDKLEEVAADVESDKPEIDLENVVEKDVTDEDEVPEFLEGEDVQVIE